jgi:hypothetical protein
MMQAKFYRDLRKRDPMGLACLLQYLKISPWNCGSIEGARHELNKIERDARGQIENSQSGLVESVVRDWTPEFKKELLKVRARLSDAINTKWGGKKSWMC